jgi:hypothetical protein
MFEVSGRESPDREEPIMMGMDIDDYMDMRRHEAGEDVPPRSHVFIPGVDFDPFDEDDVAAVMAVGERDIANREDYWRQRALRAEAALAGDFAEDAHLDWD